MRGSIATKKVAGKTRYYIVVDLPRKKGEKRKQKWIAAGTSKREAEEKLPQILLELRNKDYLSNKAMRFDEVADNYLFRAKNSLATSTYNNYAALIKQLKVYFHDYTVQEITPALVEMYLSELQQRNLAPSTIIKYRVVLRQIFAYAVELKIIQHIPIAKFKLKSHSNSYDFQVWNVEEINMFLTLIRGTPLYIPVLIASQTGMRLGEILALKWSAIDLKNHQLTVRYSVDLKGKLKPTKTKNSKRAIKLTAPLVAELEQWKRAQKLNRLKYGVHFFKNDFVCTHMNGKPLTRNYVSVTFKRKVLQCKMPVIRFHDLRHSFATIALSANIQPKVVQEILGHSTIRTTMDIYSHVMPNIQESSLEILEKAFNN